jgi:hypothetical protein
LARTFTSPCLGREPKAMVETFIVAILINLCITFQRINDEHLTQYIKLVTKKKKNALKIAYIINVLHIMG